MGDVVLSEEQMKQLVENVGGTKQALHISQGKAVVGILDLVMEIPKNIDIDAFMDRHKETKGLRVIESKSDKRLAALNEVDLTSVELMSCVPEGDNEPIRGYERLSRLKKSPNIRLGFETFYALEETEHGIKIREFLFNNTGLRYFDFFGTIFEDVVTKVRYVLFLFRQDNGIWIYDKRSLKFSWKGNTLTLPV